MTTVTFFGGVRADNPADLALAHEIGRAIGEAGATLQHGGYNGLMEHTARGAATAGGRVLAITLAGMAWGEFNPYVTDAIHLPRLGDRLHRFLDTSDLVIAMGGGIGTLHELTAALWYASNIRPVPVWLAGTAATRLLEFLRQERWVYRTPTRPTEFLREITDITDFRRAFARLLTTERTVDSNSELTARIRAGALRRGRHQLADGQVLDEYFDQYAFSADPTLLRDITSAILAQLPTDTDTLAGLALGGIPLASAAALTAGLPLACVRKTPKPYGTGHRVEGSTLTGHHVTLIDDVTRTGSQMLAAATVLRGLGAHVTTAVCVVDRALEARTTLADNGIALHPVMTQPITTPNPTTTGNRA